MKNKVESKVKYLVVGMVLVGSLLVVGTTFAATTTPTPGAGRGMMGGARIPGVFGTVSAINGNTLTVTSKGFGQNVTATTYTVDATNATVTKNDATSSVSGIVVGDNVSVQGTVSGTNVTATSIRDGMMGQGGITGQKPGIFGTVASISGNTLTITSKMGPSDGTTSTTYTVDATNATVTKAGVNSSVSNISVGDTVMVAGTVNGTSVVATTINDGVGGVERTSKTSNKTPPTSVVKGNGQPVIGGAVTAISGNTLTVTNKSNVTYTVDTTNATIEKGNVASSTSAIAVGDNVIVQGTVNGNAVVASSVIDQTKPASTTTTTSGTTEQSHQGFFAGIGSFFARIFGF
jgi:hypothetical protein